MNNHSIADMKRELLERDNYTAAELERMSALEIVSAWMELPAPGFGAVHWTNDDIEAAFEERGYTCTPADIRAIRDVCNARVYGIREAMIEAGWDFIYAAVENQHSQREAIARRAREEGIA